jgi:hypothetical protein
MAETRAPEMDQQVASGLPTARGELAAASSLSWETVNRIHRTRRGIYQRGGRLISLLTDFGRHTPCYPDAWGATPDQIIYTGEGRHGNQRLSPGNRAMLDAIASGQAVPLFNKLAAGRWQYLGLWRVIEARYVYDAVERRMLWRFTLLKARNDEGADR